MVAPFRVPTHRLPVDALESELWRPTLPSTHRRDELIPLGIICQTAQPAPFNQATKLLPFIRLRLAFGGWQAGGNRGVRALPRSLRSRRRPIQPCRVHRLAVADCLRVTINTSSHKLSPTKLAGTDVDRQHGSRTLPGLAQTPGPAAVLLGCQGNPEGRRLIVRLLSAGGRSVNREVNVFAIMSDMGSPRLRK